MSTGFKKGYVSEIIWSLSSTVPILELQITVPRALLITVFQWSSEDVWRFWSYRPYVRVVLKLSKSRLLSSGPTILLFKHVYFHVKEATYLTKSWSEANHSVFLGLYKVLQHWMTHIIWVIYDESLTGLACLLNRNF